MSRACNASQRREVQLFLAAHLLAVTALYGVALPALDDASLMPIRSDVALPWRFDADGRAHLRER